MSEWELEAELADAIAARDANAELMLSASSRANRLEGENARLREALINVMLEWVNGRQVGDGISMAVKQQVVAAIGGDVPARGPSE